MNDMSPIMQSAQGPDWTRIQADVDGWVGNCLGHIKQAEMAVSLTLDALKARDKGAIKFPTQAGQRVDQLLKHLKEAKAYEKRGLNVEAKIERFREFRDFRDMLCHGAVTIALTQHGDWIAIFENVLSQKGDAELRVLHIFQKHSAAMSAELQLACSDLKSALGRVRQTLQAGR